MSQNLFAFVAKAFGGTGAAALNLDANGNLLTAPGTVGPGGATAVSNSSGNVANAAAVATLAAAAGKTTYISGFTITGAGATAAGVVTAALTGLLGGTASFTITAPAGATVGIAPLSVTFNPPLPGSAVNTALVLTLPALGSGNTNASVSAWGYQK